MLQHNNSLCLEIIQECDDVYNNVFAQMYSWRRKGKQVQEQMEFDVSKEYKSSIADPARLVARIESHQLGHQARTNKQEKVKDFTKRIESRNK